MDRLVRRATFGSGRIGAEHFKDCGVNNGSATHFLSFKSEIAT